MPSSVSSRPSDVVFLVDASANDCAAIAPHVAAYPAALLERLVTARCRVQPLRAREKYRAASPALRRLGIDIDAWPVPPTGLFVVEERTVYLRSRSAMTIGHEVAHAVDCALGDGVYLSGFDPRIRAAFAAARAFVTRTRHPGSTSTSLSASAPTPGSLTTRGRRGRRRRASGSTVAIRQCTRSSPRSSRPPKPETPA